MIANGGFTWRIIYKSINDEFSIAAFGLPEGDIVCVFSSRMPVGLQVLIPAAFPVQPVFTASSYGLMILSQVRQSIFNVLEFCNTKKVWKVTIVTHSSDDDDDDWLVVWNIFYFPFHIWVVILPIDFHIFQRGRSTTNQMMMMTWRSESFQDVGVTRSIRRLGGEWNSATGVLGSNGPCFSWFLKGRTIGNPKILGFFQTSDFPSVELYILFFIIYCLVSNIHKYSMFNHIWDDYPWMTHIFSGGLKPPVPALEHLCPRSVWRYPSKPCSMPDYMRRPEPFGTQSITTGEAWRF